MVVVMLLAVVLIALAMLAMSVGVVLSGRCLRGSCGGPAVLGPNGESLLCDDCPKRRELESARRESELVGIGSSGRAG